MTALSLVALLFPVCFILWVWFARNRLSLSKDIFLFAIYGVLYIYLHVTPYFAQMNLEGNDRLTCILLSLASFLFFEGPMVLIYLRLKKHKYFDLPTSPLANENRRVRVLSYCAFILILAFVFCYISSKYNIFYRRIGHEGLANRSLKMSFAELIFYRTYMELGCFISISLYYLLKASRLQNKLYKSGVVLTLVIHSLIFGAFVVTNNRFQTAIFVTINFAFYVFWIRNNQGRKNIFRFFDGFKYAAVLVLSMWLCSNVRVGLDYENRIGIDTIIRIFFPNYNMAPEVARIRDVETDSFVKRTNGLDLMVKITPGILDKGLMWGRVWRDPLLVYFYKFSDPIKYEDMKRSMKTSAKTELLREYADVDLPDYYSSVLTDVYGNFGVLGFPIVAFTFAMASVLVYIGVVGASMTALGVLGLYVFPFFFYAEKEFITILMDIPKFSILPLIFYFVFVYKKKDKPQPAIPV